MVVRLTLTAILDKPLNTVKEQKISHKAKVTALHLNLSCGLIKDTDFLLPGGTLSLGAFGSFVAVWQWGERRVGSRGSEMTHPTLLAFQHEARELGMESLAGQPHPTNSCGLGKETAARSATNPDFEEATQQIFPGCFYLC